MRKRLISSLAGAAFSFAASGLAFAADMPVKAPPPVYTWTGFYIGGNVGYSWGRSSFDWNAFAPNVGLGLATVCAPAGFAFCPGPISDSNGFNGALGGFQAGVNWQLGNLVVGIETDFQFSGQKSDTNLTSIFPTLDPTIIGIVAVNQSERLQWLGTARERVGITFGRWLVYETAGLAYGRVTSQGAAVATGSRTPPLFTDCASAVNGCPFLPLASWNDAGTKLGWTVGGGIEGQIVGNLSMKLEYLYVDLGSADTTFTTLPGCFGNATPTTIACLHTLAGSGTAHRGTLRDNIVRVGLNYRFGNYYTPVVTK